MFIVYLFFMIYIDCWQFKIAVKILTCLDDVRPVYNSIVKKAINIFEFVKFPFPTDFKSISEKKISEN